MSPPQVLGQPALPMDTNKTKHYHLQNYPGGLRLGKQRNLMKNLWLIILTAGLGASCGKQENAEAEKPGAANPPGAVTPKPPPTQPKLAEKTKPSPPEQKSKPLPPAVVAAWENAGFAAGWVGPHKKNGSIRFSESLEDLDASKAVPFFKTDNWKPGVLESLPVPTSAFGLLPGQITDAGLKEVAKLQKLTTLDLMGTKITDAGLKELAKL